MTFVRNNTWQSNGALTDYPLRHNEVTNVSDVLLPTNIITDLNISYLANDEQSFYIGSVTITKASVNIVFVNQAGDAVLSLVAEKPISSSTIYELKAV